MVDCDSPAVLPKPASPARRRGSSGGGRDIVESLISLIGEEDLGVGDRLPPEIELARRLNVGRSTIREALKAWQSMGIVVRNKGAGTTLMVDVSRSIQVPLTLKLEAESLLRTHSVRRPLEIEAVGLAALHASERDRRVIRARAEELLAVYEAGEDWRPADHRFHAAIHDASGNPLFGQLIQQIQRAFADIYEAPLGKPHLGQRTLPLHRDLSDAIVARDPEAAVRIIRTILDMVEQEVRAIVDDQRG